MRQNYKFNQRIIDKESDPRYVSPGKIIDATNCRIDDSGNVVNLRGNKAIATLLPAGHVCIGAKKHKDWIYYFSTSDSVSNIGRYNVKTAVNDVLNLSNADLSLKSYAYIDFIDFLDDEENGKLLMYWTDGINPPRYYDWANPVTYSFDAAFFSVLKAAPFYEPKIRLLVYSTSDERGSIVNNIRRKMFQFAYRYIYRGGETSALSSRSRTAFYHDHSNPDFDDSGSNTLVNYFNSVEVSISMESPIENLNKQVDQIEIFAIDINLGQAFLIKTIDHDGVSINYKIDFNNNSNYPTLSAVDYGKLFDSVPRIARSQVLAEDRIMYGNYSDGIDNNIIPNWDVKITVDWSFKYQLSVGSYNLSTEMEGGEERVVTNVEVITGDIYHLEIRVKYSGGTYKIPNTDIILIAEENYARFSDFVMSPTSRVQEIFNAKGFSVRAEGEGFSIVVSNNIADVNFVSRIITRKIRSYSDSSLRRGVVYDYALAYFDEFGVSGGLIEKTNVISPMYGGGAYDYARGATVRIGHLAPTWAKKFKLYRRERKYSTVTLFRTSAKIKNQEMYLLIPERVNAEVTDNSSHIELTCYTGIPEEELVYRYANTPVVSRRIKRIETSEADDLVLVFAGRWIVIDIPTTPGYDIASGPSESRWNDSYFEIKILDDITDIAYKEIPGIYEIDENRFHKVDTDTTEYNYFPNASQTRVSSNTFGSFSKKLIYDGDVIYGYSGSMGDIMSYSRNKNMYSQLGRPQILSESYRELNRKFSVTYSSKYNYETGENGLSSFNVGLINFKDYPREYGSIKCLFYRDTDIVVFQDDKVIMQPYNKNVIEAIGGSQTLVASGDVMPQFVSYAGEYGMSHAESFAFRDNQLFWVDIKRGVILRLSQDGIFPISNFGMRTYFKNLFEGIVGNIRTEGFYDYSKDEYGISIPGEGVWHFNHSNQGWTHRINISPDILFYDGLGLYSFNGLDLYKHNELDSENFNTFYGVAIPLSFELSINEGFSDIKTLHSLFIEGDKGIIELKDQEGNITTIPEDLFENKEGVWYCFVPMNSTSSDNINMFGLGTVTGVSYVVGGTSTITFGYNIRRPQSGDVIKIGSNVGVVVTTYKTDKILATFASEPSIGEFAFIERSNIISGDYMRGNYFLLKFTVEDNTKEVKVFAINVEANKSEV